MYVRMYTRVDQMSNFLSYRVEPFLNVNLKKMELMVI